jgi:hypothetical protein
MVKKIKTPRTGKPPAGFIRVVMDYPTDSGLALSWDIDQGHRVGYVNNNALAPYGQLVRLIRRTKESGS